MPTIGILVIAFNTWLGFHGPRYVNAAGSNEYVPQDYLRWNYTHKNTNCSNADGGVIQCIDGRACRWAAVSAQIGGWPTLCGWVTKTIPKVCCGWPLILGPALVKKVYEEKARTRRCGTQQWEEGLSETENEFFKIADSLPPVDLNDNSRFDPPLDIISKTFVSPVRGETSKQGQDGFPWMVSIRRLGSHLCGGSLIDRQHILSAAHCFFINGREQNAADYMVHVGNINVDQGYPITVKKIVIHPQYDPNSHYHDLAVLTLNKEILFPQFAHICLPSPQIAATDLTGKNTALLGWRGTFSGDASTPVLHKVDNIPVVSNAECNENYKNVEGRKLPLGLTDDFICAGNRESACQGDPGGSLMYKDNPTNSPDMPWVLAGVVSFGFRCAEPDTPGVYTKVSSYVDWITKEMKE